MQKGTILYIGGFEMPDKNAAAHRVINNAKIFRDLGYNVIFISVDKNLAETSKVLETKQIIQGFDVWFVPYPQTNWQWLAYLGSIRDFKKVAAVYTDLKMVICYNYPAVALSRIANYCRRRDIRIIADCTEWYGTKGFGLTYQILKGTDTFLRMRFIHKQLDGLIVISEYLEDYYIETKNVIRIPPLVDLAEAKWQNTKTREEKGPLRFVYAGNPGGKQKDKLDSILKTLQELNACRDFRFTAIGITRQQFLADYEGMEKYLENLGEKVVFLGRLSHVESLEKIKEADFVIFIRDINRVNNAGFPTKFAEGISCGIPVITNRTSNIDDYLRDGENGIWGDDLKAALQRILEWDINKARAMKQNVDPNIFDYRAYIPKIQAWIKAQRFE